MKYQVIKAFKDIGEITRNVGDIIEVDGPRAGKLMQYRLIGLVKETAVKKAEVEKTDIEIYPESKKIQTKAKEVQKKKK